LSAKSASPIATAATQRSTRAAPILRAVAGAVKRIPYL
jgi:hypothetical protein